MGAKESTCGKTIDWNKLCTCGNTDKNTIEDYETLNKSRSNRRVNIPTNYSNMDTKPEAGFFSDTTTETAFQYETVTDASSIHSLPQIDANNQDTIYSPPISMDDIKRSHHMGSMSLDGKTVEMLMKITDTDTFSPYTSTDNKFNLPFQPIKTDLTTNTSTTPPNNDALILQHQHSVHSMQYFQMNSSDIDNNTMRTNVSNLSSPSYHLSPNHYQLTSPNHIQTQQSNVDLNNRGNNVMEKKIDSSLETNTRLQNIANIKNLEELERSITKTYNWDAVATPNADSEDEEDEESEDNVLSDDNVDITPVPDTKDTMPKFKKPELLRINTGSTNRSDKSKANIYRHGTDTPWLAEEMEDLHFEMAQQLLKLTAKESQKLMETNDGSRPDSARSTRSMRSSTMPSRSPMVAINDFPAYNQIDAQQHGHGRSASDGINVRKSINMDEITSGDSNMDDDDDNDNDGTTMKVPEFAALFREGSEKKWNKEKLEKEKNEMQKHLFHLAKQSQQYNVTNIEENNENQNKDGDLD